MSDLIKLKQNNSEVIVDPQGAYLKSWKTLGEDHLFPDQNLLINGQSKRRGGIPILFPWADELPNLPRHGFGRDLLWKIITQIPQELKLLLISNDHTTPLYPYKFEADYQITLSDNSLNLCLQITNTDSNPIPLAPGFHPYFPYPKNITGISLNNYQPGSTIHFPISQIPLISPITLIPSGDFLNPLANWAVWTDNLSYLCLEPWSAPAGGLLQVGMHLELNPQEKAVFTFQIETTPSPKAF